MDIKIDCYVLSWYWFTISWSSALERVQTISTRQPSSVPSP